MHKGDCGKVFIVLIFFDVINVCGGLMVFGILTVFRTCLLLSDPCVSLQPFGRIFGNLVVFGDLVVFSGTWMSDCWNAFADESWRTFVRVVYGIVVLLLRLASAACLAQITRLQLFRFRRQLFFFRIRRCIELGQ